jgi:hypothetical protein
MTADADRPKKLSINIKVEVANQHSSSPTLIFHLRDQMGLTDPPVSATQSLAGQRGHGVDGKSSARWNHADECSHQGQLKGQRERMRLKDRRGRLPNIISG